MYSQKPPQRRSRDHGHHSRFDDQDRTSQHPHDAGGEATRRAGCRLTHVSASQFVLRAALMSAEDVLVDQNRFVLPPERWRAFVDMLDRSARCYFGFDRSRLEAQSVQCSLNRWSGLNRSTRVTNSRASSWGACARCLSERAGVDRSEGREVADLRSHADDARSPISVWLRQASSRQTPQPDWRRGRVGNLSRWFCWRGLRWSFRSRAVAWVKPCSWTRFVGALRPPIRSARGRCWFTRIRAGSGFDRPGMASSHHRRTHFTSSS